MTTNGCSRGPMGRSAFSVAAVGLLATLAASPALAVDFEGILAVTSRLDTSANPALLVEWKKAYSPNTFTFRLYAAVDRDPVATDPSSDFVASYSSTTLSASVDPASLFHTTPPAGYLGREYHFVVVAVDSTGAATTSAAVSLTPSDRDTCGCGLSPTVATSSGAVPFFRDCTWTYVEGARACHWAMRTDQPNTDPTQTDPYDLLTAEIYFHPQAAAGRPLALALHGATAYSASGLEYASVALASHEVDGEGGDHTRGYLVVAPEMRDAYAGTIGTTAEGEETERIESAIAVWDYVHRLATPGNPAYQSALASLLSVDFSRVVVAGGSDGGITSEALAATPPGPLPFPNTDIDFPAVPFRAQIRAAFIVAPGSTASQHDMNLKDSPQSTEAQLAMPSAVMSDLKDIANSAQTAQKTYNYTIVPDPDASNPGIDKYFFHVHNGQDDVIPSRNVHVCLADPRGFPEAYECDDEVVGINLTGLPIQPGMLDHHRLLRHYMRLVFDRYGRGDTSIQRTQIVAPWYSPAHTTPDPKHPTSGYDASGYPVPAVLEETGPKS